MVYLSVISESFVASFIMKQIYTFFETLFWRSYLVVFYLLFLSAKDTQIIAIWFMSQPGSLRPLLIVGACLQTFSQELQPTMVPSP